MFATALFQGSRPVANSSNDLWLWVLGGLLVLLVILVLVLLKFISLWVQAYMSGTRIGLLVAPGTLKTLVATYVPSSRPATDTAAV